MAVLRSTITDLRRDDGRLCIRFSKRGREFHDAQHARAWAEGHITQEVADALAILDALAADATLTKSADVVGKAVDIDTTVKAVTK